VICSKAGLMKISGISGWRASAIVTPVLAAAMARSCSRARSPSE
jgi:hypothetical protein